MQNQFDRRLDGIWPALQADREESGGREGYENSNPFLSDELIPIASSAELKPGTPLVNGRFTIKSRIAAGRVGVIYSAKDRWQTEDVALKVVPVEPQNPKKAELVFREYEASKRIQDFRHVIRTYDIHHDRRDGIDILVLSMDLAEGGSFRDWLSKHRNDWETRKAQGLVCFKQICRGVAAMHEVGLIHLQLKPEHFLFSKGLIKVCDLATAKLIRQFQTSNSPRSLTLFPELYTVAYSSPKHITAAHPDNLDIRADIYVLGLILFEILHRDCRPPFGGDKDRIRECHLRIPAPPLKEAGETTARVIARCLEKDPSDCYETVQELMDDLEERAREVAFEDPLLADMWEQACITSAKKNFNEATRILKEILIRDPELEKAKNLLEYIHSQYTRAARVLSVLNTCMDGMNIDFADGLMDVMDEVYPDHPLREKVKTRRDAKVESYKKALRQGYKAAEMGCWGQAEYHFEEARCINPLDYQALSLKSWVSDIKTEIMRETESIALYNKMGRYEDVRRATVWLDKMIDEWKLVFRKMAVEAWVPFHARNT